LLLAPAIFFSCLPTADINFVSKNSESRAKFYACSGAAVSRKNQGSFLREAIVNPTNVGVNKNELEVNISIIKHVCLALWAYLFS
jgi:5-keto 4-deoxyuronate isomerase